MALIKRTVTTSHPSALTALKALAAIVGLIDDITFCTEASTSDSFSLQMTVVTKNPFSGNDVSYTVSGFVACAKAICKAVPESGIWGQMSGDTADEAAIESWVEKAAALIFPAYHVSDGQGKFLAMKSSKLSRVKNEFVRDLC